MLPECLLRPANRFDQQPDNPWARPFALKPIEFQSPPKPKPVGWRGGRRTSELSGSAVACFTATWRLLLVVPFWVVCII